MSDVKQNQENMQAQAMAFLKPEQPFNRELAPPPLDYGSVDSWAA